VSSWNAELRRGPIPRAHVDIGTVAGMAGGRATVARASPAGPEAVGKVRPDAEHDG
jgi:hypothetical protein